MIKIASNVLIAPDGESSHARHLKLPACNESSWGSLQLLSVSLLIGTSFDQLFHCLALFLVGVFDFLYAFSEFCSVVSNKICGLQNLCVFRQFSFALRI